MIRRNDIEIMAPVGSYEALWAAIQGGTNSVYFGIEKMNMRAHSSNNFSFDDLKEIVTICKEHGVKSYLTVNTIVYDQELPLLHEILDTAKAYDITAVIASDIAAIHYAREIGLEVHISTQVNITNIESLKFYAQYADVVVLARELTLEQVKAIHNEILKQDIRGPKGKLIQIEMFVHGALCMAVSGKCYLSLHEKNHSANRGACMQTCRKAYIVTEKESGNELEIDNSYIMSPKDLCTIGFLNKMLDAGVRVLKIEGRARPAEYVQTVVKSYSKAITAIEKKEYNQELIDELRKDLATVFNRGFWDGYYLGQRLGEWSHRYGSRATKRKMYLGKITNYFSKLGVAEILLESGSLTPEEEVLVMGPTTGVVKQLVREIRVDRKPVAKAQKRQFCSIATDSLVRRNDKVYKWVDADKVKQQ
ncbi:MAG: peptidase U32 family protein [Bacteroidota bacterium]